MSAGISHWLNRTLGVWRKTNTPDGSGGFVVTWSQVGEIRAKVDQPGAEEQIEAQQAGAALLRNIYTEPSSDVRRGDELRGDGDTFRIASAIQPSSPIYLKLRAELVQPEGDEIGS